MTKIVIAILPFILTAVTGAESKASPDSLEAYALPFVQYGALGLCAVMVGFLCWHLEKMRGDIKSLNANLLEAYKENSRVIDKQSKMLNDRPCLVNDTRLKINED